LINSRHQEEKALELFRIELFLYLPVFKNVALSTAGKALTDSI